MKHSNFDKTLTLFLTFLKIGAFTFGGGYAMVALLESEFIYKKKWIEKDDFLNMIAIAESTPGPMAVNSATYIGYHVAGFYGATAATLAVCIPSFIIIYCISLFFNQFLSLHYITCAFKGIQVCVVYLILTVGIRMLKNLERNLFNTLIILIVAIPLKIESPGPLIFKQQRVGKNGRIFNIYKLRSMYQDAEERKKALMEQNKMDGHMFKMDNDPRITKVGKFIRKTSIDELPQFWNVLKGDMSLVGTRPPTVDEFEKYESHHKRRLSMKPGITGKWQVSGRSDIQDFEEVVKLDCEYIDEWSPFLDIQILFKTVGVVLTHKGAE